MRNLLAFLSSQVRYWLDFVGLSQHRYKFAAHAVDGKTLFKLSDDYLKYEVGVQAVGHRQEILECIEASAHVSCCSWMLGS